MLSVVEEDKCCLAGERTWPDGIPEDDGGHPLTYRYLIKSRVVGPYITVCSHKCGSAFSPCHTMFNHLLHGWKTSHSHKSLWTRSKHLSNRRSQHVVDMTFLIPCPLLGRSSSL